MLSQKDDAGVCCPADAFYAAVEELDTPYLVSAAGGLPNLTAASRTLKYLHAKQRLPAPKCPYVRVCWASAACAQGVLILSE